MLPLSRALRCRALRCRKWKLKCRLCPINCYTSSLKKNHGDVYLMPNETAIKAKTIISHTQKKKKKVPVIIDDDEASKELSIQVSSLILFIGRILCFRPLWMFFWGSDSSFIARSFPISCFLPLFTNYSHHFRVPYSSMNGFSVLPQTDQHLILLVT